MTLSTFIAGCAFVLSFNPVTEDFNWLRKMYPGKICEMQITGLCLRGLDHPDCQSDLRRFRLIYKPEEGDTIWM